MNIDNLNYIVTHVSLPPKLPQESDWSSSNEYSLCQATHRCAVAYMDLLPQSKRAKWKHIIRLLQNLTNLHAFDNLSSDEIQRCMAGMITGGTQQAISSHDITLLIGIKTDVIALFIREQNAGLIVRRFDTKTVFESFEVSLPNATVLAAKGKVNCSYPGPAIAVSNVLVDDPNFRKELASFLAQMSVDVLLDATPKTVKAQSKVVEVRDTIHPRYITELLTGILRGMGHPAQVHRISKRIADDVLWNNADLPWRRSPLWLIIRVGLQTSLYDGGHDDYKSFMTYFMSQLLSLTVQHSFSSDLIYWLRAKVSRRLLKQGSSTPQYIITAVSKEGQTAEILLQERWNAIQKNQKVAPSWDPAMFHTENDKHMSLRNSKNYIMRRSRALATECPPFEFQPHHHPRLCHACDPFYAFNEQILSAAITADASIALADFEASVRYHLDAWVDTHMYEESACETVAACITLYAKASQSRYEANPEDQSIMLLTLLELWIVLDKLAVNQLPLLKQYSPSIPVHLWGSLLLRKSESIQRLSVAEQYLYTRHQHAVYGSVFTDVIDSHSFSVRYFDQSHTCRELLDRISRDAKQNRELKRQELRSKNVEHATLTSEIHCLTCTLGTNRWGYINHLSYCRKCYLQSRADSMQIHTFEWPLPENSLKAKVVVFELRLPTPFRVWRTITYQILHDICQSPSDDDANPPVELQTYQGLQMYVNLHQISRITYASETKSFLNSHYKTSKIPSTESVVCVNNGLQFKLYDKIQRCWAAGSFNNCSVARRCTLQLPKRGPYKSMQYAINGTSHTSNEVLANQSECPSELNIHEYYAFGTLRSGPRIQWLNIARELAARTLSFHQEEVQSLIMQAAFQIGPLIGDRREWHIELGSSDFDFVLLSELSSLFNSIRQNWLRIVSVQSIILLTTRLISSANDGMVLKEAYRLLKDIREVTFNWMHQLTQKLGESQNDSEVAKYQSRLCIMATTCRGTYDVDVIHLAALLASDRDVAVFVECAIQVHNNTPPVASNIPLNQQRLLARDRRLSQRLEDALWRQIQDSQKGLDDAVTVACPAYQPGEPWDRLSEPNHRWVSSKTAASAGVPQSCIHFNLLDGTLLINGSSPMRLPKNITDHSTYIRVFHQVRMGLLLTYHVDKYMSRKYWTSYLQKYQG